jgi:iron complex outermembrane receptor protein
MKSLLLMTCAASALTLGAGHALAEDAATAASAAATANGGTTIGEVVVTAERREASLQKVPEAVTAFTAKDRNIKGITTIQDMTNFTPGLTYSSALDRPAIRGISKNNNIYTADSGVAIYYDDFYSNSAFLVGRDDMFIDQVEVLVGPQGTLYGRNAIGGLINTTTKHPTDDYSGEFRVAVGNYQYTKVEGTFAGPITDRLSFRVGGYLLDQNQGYFHNLVPGKPSEGDVRHDPYMDVQLQYKDAKNLLWLDANTIAFHHDRGGPGSLLGTPTVGEYDHAPVTTGQIFFNPNAAFGPGAVPGSVQEGNVPANALITSNPALTHIRDFAHQIPTDIYVHAAYTITLHGVHHFDGFDAKYVGGYSQYHYHLNTSLFGNDNSPVSSYQIALDPHGTCAYLSQFGRCGPLTVYPEQNFIYETHAAWWSNELTFSSTTDKPLQWIGGLYQYHETNNNPQTVQAQQQAQLQSPLNALGGGNPAVPTGSTYSNPSRYYYLTDYQATIESFAGYGQLDWKITPTIKLTGGFRYTYDQKRANEQAGFVGFTNLVPGTGARALNAPNLGALLPAVDLTTALIDPHVLGGERATGVSCLAHPSTALGYNGVWARCLKDHSDAPTGTAGITWTPDRSTLAYLRYVRGYKAFGFNAGNLSRTPYAAPEYVDDVEGGIKKTFNGNLQIDAAAFYYNYTNAQLPLGVPTGGINLTQFFNVPKAESEGFELTVDWRPISHLDLSVVYGLNHTSISSGCSAADVAAIEAGAHSNAACYIDSNDPLALAPGAHPVGALTTSGNYYQSVKGNELPQAPENKVAFNTNYTWVFDPGRLTLSGSYVWKDVSYSSVFTRNYDRAPSWNQVDLRAVWSGHHDRYEIVAYVRNLFDTLGYDAAASAYIAGTAGAGNYTQHSAYDLTPPRTYGVEFHYKF